MEVNKWWSSLTVENKERIARKVVEKVLPDWDGGTNYPECTRLWHNLNEEQKESVKEHCTDRHGYVAKEWREGESMSY